MIALTSGKARLWAILVGVNVIRTIKFQLGATRLRSAALWLRYWWQQRGSSLESMTHYNIEFQLLGRKQIAMERP